MIVLDSNVWVRGSYTHDERAVALLEAIDSGEKSTVVDAYIVNEVQAVFDRQRGQRRFTREIIEKAERIFYELLTRPNVTSCSQRAVESLDHIEHRKDRYVQLLSDVFDIQAKDAPIIALAYQYRDTHPVIYTHDESFAALDPSVHGLSELVVEHVPDTAPPE